MSDTTRLDYQELRTISQATDIAMLGAFWERRGDALTGNVHYKNFTQASVIAQVGGLVDTIHLVIGLIIVGLILSLWALSIWLRQRRQQVITPDIDT